MTPFTTYTILLRTFCVYWRRSCCPLFDLLCRLKFFCKENYMINEELWFTLWINTTENAHCKSRICQVFFYGRHFLEFTMEFNMIVFPVCKYIFQGFILKKCTWSPRYHLYNKFNWSNLLFFFFLEKYNHYYYIK